MVKSIAVSKALTIRCTTGTFGGMGKPRSVGFDTLRRALTCSWRGCNPRLVIVREVCLNLWSKELCFSFIWDPPVPKVKKKRPEAFQPYEFSAGGKG
jgi:hypothetical protein